MRRRGHESAESFNLRRALYLNENWKGKHGKKVAGKARAHLSRLRVTGNFVRAE